MNEREFIILMAAGTAIFTALSTVYVLGGMIWVIAIAILADSVLRRIAETRARRAAEVSVRREPG